VSATPEPEHRTATGSNSPAHRLTRIQQLTLTTWRHASAKVARDVPPNDILAQVAICVVRAVLHDVAQPLALFARHADGAEEFALAASLAGPGSSRDAVHDVMDTGFLLRWVELTRNGRGPEELPPLTRRIGHKPLLP
jgi:hypothetical protein